MSCNTCTFDASTKGSSCANGCGYRLKRDYEKPPHRNCPAWKPLLGFVVARILERIGIIKYRYLRTKERLLWPVSKLRKLAITIRVRVREGRPATFDDYKVTCRCEARKQFLNRWIAPRWLTWLSGMTTKNYDAQAAQTNEGATGRDTPDLQAVSQVGESMSGLRPVEPL